ncbi:MAG: TonB-dependent receptor [Bacteroidota bacterium]|jgi:vitamin B12 transporter|nr:TonB-dependent receptor [Bacteroidota bacterium]
MKKEKTLIMVGALTCLNLSVSAQDSLKKKELNEVVITATRSEKKAEDVGRSISVISAEEIKNSGVSTVSELLARQEGIYVVGAGQNPGMTSSIFMRGANSNQTILLIDGVRITDPSAINNAIDASELSLANISRIEIVRGSHSTLYGSAAIGGVVNIITRKAQKPGLSVDATVVAGTFGSGTSEISENIYVDYALKNGFYAGVELYNTNVNGLDATVDTVKSPATFKHSDMSDDFNKIDYVGKLGFKNDKFDVYASYKQTHQLTDIDQSAYRDDDNYTLDFNRSLITYGASYKFNDKLNASYIGGFTKMKRLAVDDSSVVDALGTSNSTYNRGEYEGAVLSNEVQANYTMKGLNVVLGAGMYNESMNVNTRYNSVYYNDTTSLDSIKPQSSTSNVFLHTDLGGELFSSKLNWLTLSGGLRMSNHNVFGTNVTYEINPSVKTSEGGLLYFSYSTGYNAPSLYQLYDPTKYTTWDMSYSTGLSRGNKKLNPESSKTYEIGFKQKLGNINLSVAYFKTVVENVIEYVYLWDKNIGIDTLGQNWFRDDYRGDTYINAATMTTEGVELGFSSKINEKFFVSANLSLTSGKLSYNPDDIDTSHTGGNHVQVFSNGAFMTNKNVEVIGLTRRPSTANLSLTYLPIKILSLRADVRYVGSRADATYEPTLGPYGAQGTVSVRQYTLLDVSANVKIWKGLSAGARVSNVFDEKYYEINGFTTRGRGIYGNLKYTF